jgi:hypothetical protein
MTETRALSSPLAGRAQVVPPHLHRAIFNAVLSINETANFESNLLTGTLPFSLRTPNSKEEVELNFAGFHQRYVTPSSLQTISVICSISLFRLQKESEFSVLC